MFLKKEFLKDRFSCYSLNGDETPEEEKFLYVAEILRKAIELSTFEKHIEHEDIKHQNLSSNSSISEGIDEDDSVADELPVEKVALYNKIPLKLYISFSMS